MPNKKDTSFLGRLIDGLFSIFKTYFTKQKVLDFLEKKLIQQVLTKFIVVTGWKAWVVKYVVKNLMDMADEKAVEPFLRQLGFIKNVSNGKVTYERLATAKDIDDWRDATDNV